MPFTTSNPVLSVERHDYDGAFQSLLEHIMHKLISMPCLSKNRALETIHNESYLYLNTAFRSSADFLMTFAPMVDHLLKITPYFERFNITSVTAVSHIALFVLADPQNLTEEGWCFISSDKLRQSLLKTDTEAFFHSGHLDESSIVWLYCTENGEIDKLVRQ